MDENKKLLELCMKYQDEHNKWIKIGQKMGGLSPDTVRKRASRLFGNLFTKQTVSKPKIIDVQKFTDDIIHKILNTKYNLLNIKYEGKHTGKYKEEAVLMLSDIHIGKKNTFLNIETGKNEITYDMNIMVKEANRLIEAVNEIVNILSPSYLFERLNIFALGDILDNHIIYKGQAFHIEADVGKQIWIANQTLIDLVQAFLRIFKRIRIVSVPGNHGRMSESNADMPVTSSFDYLLFKILQTYFRNESRVEFVIPESWFCIAQIKNWKYLLHHGNTIYSYTPSLPYYGITKQSKARRTEMQYSIECIGHFHQRMEIPTSSKTYTIINGSWIQADSYAWKKYGVISKPEQAFFGVSDKRPMSWSFNIDLSKAVK